MPTSNNVYSPFNYLKDATDDMKIVKTDVELEIFFRSGFIFSAVYIDPELELWIRWVNFSEMYTLTWAEPEPEPEPAPAPGSETEPEPKDRKP